MGTRNRHAHRQKKPKGGEDMNAEEDNQFGERRIKHTHRKESWEEGELHCSGAS